MIALFIAVLAGFVALLIVVEMVKHARAKKVPKLVRRGRRQPDLEDYIRGVVKNLRHGLGEIFLSYEVWKVEREMRLNLRAAPVWKRLSELTRSQILRKVWQALEGIAGQAVVIVDSPPQRWSREIDGKFDWSPLGLAAADAYAASAEAPQFFKER